MRIERPLQWVAGKLMDIAFWVVFIPMYLWLNTQCGLQLGRNLARDYWMYSSLDLPE